MGDLRSDGKEGRKLANAVANMRTQVEHGPQMSVSRELCDEARRCDVEKLARFLILEFGEIPAEETPCTMAIRLIHDSLLLIKE